MLTMPISPRFFPALMLLVTALAFSSAEAQEAAPGNDLPPATEIAPSQPQPEAAAPAAAATDKPVAAPKKAATPKKKSAKKTATDFKKKHSAKKKSAAPKAPPPKDPSVSEPTEDIQAIKNRAEQQFWEGKPDAGKVSLPGGAALERASASQLAGVTFDDQPLRMPESESFRRSIDTVAFELGRPCRAREYLGWPLQQTEQARVDRIFGETIEKLRQRGFAVQPHQPKSAGADLSVFTAERVTGEFDRHILGLWSAGDVGLLLMLCDTEKTPSVKEAVKKAAPVKAQPVKSSAKKPAPKKAVAKKEVEEPEPVAESVPEPAPAPPSAASGNSDRPVVMPGVAPSEAVTPPQ